MKGRLASAAPSTLLLVFMLTVPALVVVAGIAAVLLTRSGYGILVGLVVPSLALSAATVALGVLLGRAANRRARRDIERRERKPRG